MRARNSQVEATLNHPRAAQVATAVRDALRFEFARLRAAHPSVAREWTGAFSFDEDVVATVRDFVRKGPHDWRCHGITHFRNRVLEPEFDAAVNALLQRSRVRVDETPWTRLHEAAQKTTVYTSSLLLRTTPRAVNPNTPYERTVVDVSWDVLHLPDMAAYDARHQRTAANHAHATAPLAVWLRWLLGVLLSGALWG